LQGKGDFKFKMAFANRPGFSAKNRFAKVFFIRFPHKASGIISEGLDGVSDLRFSAPFERNRSGGPNKHKQPFPFPTQPPLVMLEASAFLSLPSPCGFLRERKIIELHKA
jgi:hypothetical protein